MNADNKSLADSGNQLPQTLLDANIELSRRMGKLIQENNQRWSEFVAKAFGEGRGNMEKLLSQNNGYAPEQTLNDFMQNLTQCAACNQALAQQALENQKAFMSALTHAWQHWQQQSIGMAGNMNAAPWNNMFADLLKQMNSSFVPFKAGANEDSNPKESSKGNRQ